MMEIKEEAMAVYFEPFTGLYQCKRHGFPGVMESGQCPSCSSYAMNWALSKAAERPPLPRVCDICRKPLPDDASDWYQSESGFVRCPEHFDGLRIDTAHRAPRERVAMFAYAEWRHRAETEALRVLVSGLARDLIKALDALDDEGEE